MSGFNFNFDLENFGLGLLTGWGTAYLLYRARKAISQASDSVTSRATKAREFAARSADAGYINDMLKVIRADHLAGDRVALREILVEPRFIRVDDLIAPQEEEIVPDVFAGIPRIHDYPYLHAPYNLHTFTVSDLDNGDRALALLGLPGSGRTTALYAIMLWSMGEVDFEPPDDIMQIRLEDKEGAAALAARAEGAYRNIQDITPEDVSERSDDPDAEPVGLNAIRKQVESAGVNFRQLTPMYTHLANVNISVMEHGRNVDPAEPLVRAFQHYVGYNTRMKLGNNFYKRLEEGRVLLLLDGLDELPRDEQLLKLEWLRQLREAYSNNFIIVSGSVRGYGGLLQAGYTPVYMRPWDDHQIEEQTGKFAAGWGKISGGGRRRSAELDSETVALVKSRYRAYTPLELTLRTWAIYDTPTQTAFPSWVNHFLAGKLSEGGFAEARSKLMKAAELQLEHGFIMPEMLDRALLGATESDSADDPAGSSVALDDLDAELDALSEIGLDDDSGGQAVAADDDDIDLDDVLGALDSDTQIPVDEKSARVDKETAAFIKQMVKAGVFRRFRGGRIQFCHPVIAAYLASLTLADLRFDKLVRRAEQPAWRGALAYAASHMPLDEVVRVRMEAPVDILLTNLLDTAQWIKYASGTVEWVPKLMRVLGKLFAARRQYPALRERIAAALVSSYDKNAIRIFERSLGHPDADVRRLSVLGLGALKSEKSAGDIAAMIDDPVAAVSVAATLALGAIGTQEAIDRLTETLVYNESESIRQAVTESLAAHPAVGHEILYEAMQDDNVMVRRAAVFGLRRIPTPWALVVIYEQAYKDVFYAQSAASQVFLDMRYGRIAIGPRRYPQAVEVAWVREWLASIEDRGRTSDDASAVLRRALDEGDVEIQYLAVGNMGQLGVYDQTGTLYLSLRHREESIRDVAYRALTNIQLQLNTDLPAPIAVG